MLCACTIVDVWKPAYNWRGWFCPYTLWVPVIELGSLGLASKGLYLPSYFASPHSEFKNRQSYTILRNENENFSVFLLVEDHHSSDGSMGQVLVGESEDLRSSLRMHIHSHVQSSLMYSF